MSEVLQYFDANALLTTREAATHLAVSPRTLEGWRRVGKGPRPTALGRLVRYRTADVIAYVMEASGAAPCCESKPAPTNTRQIRH